jgi:large subunit ribosomal protein L24e
MPVRRSCSFCGNEIEPGTGKMFIKKDGTVFVFCSSKCQANMLKLGRVPRWTPWTQAFRRASAGAAAAVAEPLVVEETPAVAGAAVDVTIETPKGKDIPADLGDLIDKRLGPDLSRGDIERYFSDFIGSPSFRNSIIGWARKSHGGKPFTLIQKPEFLAWKDSAEGRRVFKAWLDSLWAQVKGRKVEPEEEGEPTPPPKAAKKAKKGT